MNTTNTYSIPKDQYAKYGIDTDAAIE